MKKNNRSEISNSFLFSSTNALVECVSSLTIPYTGIWSWRLYVLNALFIAFICVIPPSAKIRSGNVPNPPFGFSKECFWIVYY